MRVIQDILRNEEAWFRITKQPLQDLIHVKKISIEGIKKLLEYAACWDIMGCSEEVRGNCSAFRKQVKAVPKAEEDDRLYRTPSIFVRE